jgi:hypothetical protein
MRELILIYSLQELDDGIHLPERKEERRKIIHDESCVDTKFEFRNDMPREN